MFGQNLNRSNIELFYPRTGYHPIVIGIFFGTNIVPWIFKYVPVLFILNDLEELFSDLILIPVSWKLEKNDFKLLYQSNIDEKHCNLLFINRLCAHCLPRNNEGMYRGVSAVNNPVLLYQLTSKE